MCHTIFVYGIFSLDYLVQMHFEPDFYRTKNITQLFVWFNPTTVLDSMSRAHYTTEIINMYIHVDVLKTCF